MHAHSEKFEFYISELNGISCIVEAFGENQ
jgi:hypothetical protein